MQLDAARVLVTGASKGIGEAIARRCHGAGAHLALAARDRSRLDALAAELGSRASVHPIDLSDPGALEGWIGRVEAEVGGPVDVLVNNAGLDEVGPLTAKSADDVRRIHQVNLIAPIELTRQALPGMLGRGSGHLVNVSSMAAVGAFSGMAIYGSTKAGLSNFTRVLRHELHGSPIGLTLVSLGPVPTDMLAHVGSFRPTEVAFRRFRRLQLMPNVDREVVADAVVDAIRADKRHVRLPKRAAGYPMLAEVPQRLIDLVMVRSPRR
jgi:short-subunit dehydrogenase